MIAFNNDVIINQNQFYNPTDNNGVTGRNWFLGAMSELPEGVETPAWRRIRHALFS
ncbi:hypothetical protein M2103_002501 [Ereboglobus sp. PH5-5]|uniref:hypothetical protein n=1 Tax=unclassified Ereboglobus TaxID=2626932 RepID=UPI0024055E13|nr:MULTISPECIES: hypothetical protein [unclassified Ereboglobus]MDF9827958.1 hypothetical protein [Ereboglobus sp. PH5-10]MDF9834259.1 hypothetical protein [Ereboglobus sp. PH5-5]